MDASSVDPADVDESSVVLIDGSPAERPACVRLLHRLAPSQRQRTLLVGWSLDLRTVRQFADAGVGDFLNMPASTKETILRLELRSRARSVPPGGSIPRRVDSPNKNALPGIVGSPVSGVRLSERELLVYNLLVEQFGQPVSRKEILRRVWDRDEYAATTSNIVDVYIRYLRVKLARAAPQVRIVAIRHVGYALEATGEESA